MILGLLGLEYELIHIDRAMKITQLDNGVTMSPPVIRVTPSP